MAAITFEHGCPDNCPAILWMTSDNKGAWLPIFPDRAILSGEKSVFPPEVVRGDALTTLLDLGQRRLAMSGQLLRRGELGETILVILALIAKGQRRLSALSFATGLNSAFCIRILDKCIYRWGFLTSSLRVTKRGHAELEAARKMQKVVFKAPERGTNIYFPQQLRRTTSG